jgi:S-adenosylmethionine decarboxylase
VRFLCFFAALHFEWFYESAHFASYSLVARGPGKLLYDCGMQFGTEWLVEATGCDAAALRDVARLREVFARVVAELDLRVVGEAVWHKFPAPGGVTGLALLTESHLACHTYPEWRLATFNLYCCRVRPAWPWAERLREMLDAETVQVREMARVSQ